MDTDTEGRNAATDAYWRRRVYVLGGALAAVGVFAWACSGPDHKKSTAQVRNAAASLSASPAPSAPAQPGAIPTATVTITASPTVTPPPPKQSGDACDKGDVVVGMTPTKTTYKGKEYAQFRLSVVNAGTRPCTFDVGGRSLQIRIASGSDRVWSSAECGTPSNIQLLRRGVPYLSTLDWNRHRCTGPTAQPGTYVVTAKGPGVKAPKQVFRLR